MLKDAKINEVFTPFKRAHIIKCLKSLIRLYFINMLNPHLSVFSSSNNGYVHRQLSYSHPYLPQNNLNSNFSVSK